VRSDSSLSAVIAGEDREGVEMADEPATTTETVSAEQIDEQLAEDVLVEEVSIDGMCGVY
jgi:mycofactocin precursor